MPNELNPLVDQWYFHIDKGQRFFVTAIDEEAETIEVQHFDGDLEEFSFDQWRELDIELSEEPENWTGAMDITNRDDLGTEVTDTAASDWNEPLRELRSEGEGDRKEEDTAVVKSYGSKSGIDTTKVLGQPGGEYRERLGDTWLAEYAEDKETGLWRAVLYKRDSAEWDESGFASLEDAVQSAHNYFYNEA